MKKFSPKFILYAAAVGLVIFLPLRNAHAVDYWTQSASLPTLGNDPSGNPIYATPPLDDNGVVGYDGDGNPIYGGIDGIIVGYDTNGYEVLIPPTSWDTWTVPNGGTCQDVTGYDGDGNPIYGDPYPCDITQTNPVFSSLDPGPGYALLSSLPHDVPLFGLNIGDYGRGNDSPQCAHHYQPTASTGNLAVNDFWTPYGGGNSWYIGVPYHWTPYGQDNTNGYASGDCVQFGIQQQNGGVYTTDFRVGLRVGTVDNNSPTFENGQNEAPHCAATGNAMTDWIYTPWASQGGGTINTARYGNLNCFQLTVQTQPLPPGVTQISNVSFGMSEADVDDSIVGGTVSNTCSLSYPGALLTNNSASSYPTNGDCPMIDGHDAITQLFLTLGTSGLGAQYVSDNIPRTVGGGEVITVGSDNQPLSFVVKNTGNAAWISDQSSLVPGSATGKCDGANGTSPTLADGNGASCTATYNYSSSKITLKHISGSFTVSSDPAPYQKAVQVTNTVVTNPPDCEDVFNNHANKPLTFLDKVVSFILSIPRSFAMSIEPTQCVPGGQEIDQSFSTSPDVAPGTTVNFYIGSLTAPTIGASYTEVWQTANSLASVQTSDLGAHGGGGGTAFSDTCPSGTALIGIQGQSGSLDDEIQGICQNSVLLGVHGAYGRSSGQAPVYGPDTCPAGSVMVGLQGRAGQYNDQIQGICQNSALLGAHGGGGGTAFSDTCPAGYLLTGLRGRAAQYVDQIQGICQQGSGASFGDQMPVTIKIGNSINVVSVNSQTGEPVTGQWQFTGSADSPCGTSDGTCPAGTTGSYTNQATGTYNFSGVWNTAGGEFSLSGVREIAQAPARKSNLSFADLVKQLFVPKALAMSACDTDNITGYPVTSAMCPAGQSVDSQSITSDISNIDFAVTWDPIAKMQVSVAPLSFTSNEGTNPATQALNIQNVGANGSKLLWTTNSSSSWLSVSPSGDSTNGVAVGAPATPPVTINSSALSPGTYNGAISITGTSLFGGVTPTTQIIPVTLTVINCAGGSCGGGSAHLECVNSACTIVSGGGANKDGCGVADASCSGGTSGSTHLACQNNSCALFSGAGANQDGCSAAGAACNGGGGNLPASSCVFTVDKTQIVPPQTASLQWICSGFSSCVVTPGNYTGTSGGPQSVSPTKNTTYTLSCDGGTYTQDVNVIVNNPGLKEINP